MRVNPFRSISICELKLHNDLLWDESQFKIPYFQMNHIKNYDDEILLYVIIEYSNQGETVCGSSHLILNNINYVFKIEFFSIFLFYFTAF